MDNNHFILYVILLNIIIKKIIVKLQKLFKVENNIINDFAIVIFSSLISSLLICMFINIDYNITFIEYKNINNLNINLTVNKNIDFNKYLNKFNDVGIITNFIF
jgi:hypothetical protein